MNENECAAALAGVLARFDAAPRHAVVPVAVAETIARIGPIVARVSPIAEAIGRVAPIVAQVSPIAAVVARAQLQIAAHAAHITKAQREDIV